MKRIVAGLVIALLFLASGEEAHAWRLRLPRIRINLFNRRHGKKDRKKASDQRRTNKKASSTSSSKKSSQNQKDTTLYKSYLKYRRVGSGNQLSQRELDILIRHYSRRHRVDHQLVKAVMKVESNFNPICVSSAGAMGLMQLMPGTAHGLGVRNPWNPEENIAGGVKYLASMLKRFRTTKLALAAYNAGPGAVKKYNGVPPYDETQRYIKKVMSAYQEYRRKG